MSGTGATSGVHLDLDRDGVFAGNPVPLHKVGETRDGIIVRGARLLATLAPFADEQLDRHVETFPLIVLTTHDEAVSGFLFGSLERIGGTPCILWGLGASKKGRQSGTAVKGMVSELYRRAAISFPDEDVLVAGRIAHPAAYGLVGQLDDVVPRPPPWTRTSGSPWPYS